MFKDARIQDKLMKIYGFLLLITVVVLLLLCWQMKLRTHHKGIRK